jgi:hypothetical protein
MVKLRYAPEVSSTEQPTDAAENVGFALALPLLPASAQSVEKHGRQLVDTSSDEWGG